MADFNAVATLTQRMSNREALDGKQKVRAYVSGETVPLLGLNNPGGTILEVELPDGRTVQLTVHNDGGVMVRGWGNIPGKVGNSNSLTLNAMVPPEAPSTCEKCHNKFAMCGCER